MTCPKCHAENDDKAYSCFYCGTQLREPPRPEPRSIPTHAQVVRAEALRSKGRHAWVWVLAAVAVLAAVVAIVQFSGRTERPASSQNLGVGGAYEAKTGDITGYASVTASSWCRPSPKYGSTFVPTNATDGDPTTAWIEGAKDEGCGEYLQLTFPRSVEVDYLRILPGYAKAAADDMGDRWEKNFRIRTMRIILDGRTSVEARFDDRRGYQDINLGGVQAKQIRLVIGSVYAAGAIGRDTPISEVRVIGKM